jgi:hypothetical protein
LKVLPQRELWGGFGTVFNYKISPRPSLPKRGTKSKNILLDYRRAPKSDYAYTFYVSRIIRESFGRWDHAVRDKENRMPRHITLSLETS